jgi:hypothetical protein
MKKAVKSVKKFFKEHVFSQEGLAALILAFLAAAVVEIIKGRVENIKDNAEPQISPKNVRRILKSKNRVIKSLSLFNISIGDIIEIINFKTKKAINNLNK